MNWNVNIAFKRPANVFKLIFDKFKIERSCKKAIVGMNDPAELPALKSIILSLGLTLEYKGKRARSVL